MTSPVPRTPPTQFVILVIFSFVIQGGVGQQQRFSVCPESVEVSEGDDVFLRCVVEHQQGKAQWTKDGFALGFERGVPGYPRYQYAGDPELGEHHLVITGVTLTEDGEYQCQVGPTDTSPPIWAAANLTVLLSPRRVRLVGWDDGAVVEVVSGTSLTLECVVEDARPPPRAAWYRAGLLLHPADSQVDHVEPSTSPRRWNVRSQVKVTARPGDDGRAVSCQALHPTLQDLPTPLAASVTLSVLHPPGPPVISGYTQDEVLLAGERRSLSCRSTGGNPRPWVLWYRQGRLVDDTTTTVRGGDDQSKEQGVVNEHELAVTPQEDSALYECRVTSDLLETPLTANLTLTVYYAPATVTISGASQVEAGGVLNLTCESSDSNPPASLTWTIQGEVLVRSKAVVGRDGSGGWVTSSHLTHLTPTPTNLTHLTVECRALNPAIERVVRKVTTVTIIRPAGHPEFECDLSEALLAGTNFDLTCVSVGGHPPPTIRVYKGEEEVATEVSVDVGVARARAEVEVRPSDNGVDVRCEAVNPASPIPLTTSHTLSVLFAPWEVRGSVKPSTVEAGEVVTLRCDASSSIPPSSLTWTSQQATIDGAITTTTPGMYGGSDTRSELHLSTAAEDNGRSFTCEASNGLGVAVNTNLVLNVLHSPLWVVRPAEQLDVHEGTQLVITASATANPGPIRYWWRREEETLEATGGELRLGSVSRSASGNYSVSAYNPRGAINASFFLNIQYGAEQVEAAERVTVGEGGAATIECTAHANPPPTLTWTRDAHNSSSQMLSTGVGLARLVLEEATWADTGVYLCHASNVVSSAPSVATKVIVTQAPVVTQEGGGVGGAWAAVGGEGRLVCRVRAAPAPTFVWTTQDDLSLHNTEKYVIHDPQLVDGLVVWAGVLEVRAVQEEDYAQYKCTAHNPLGSDSAHLALNPPTRPHTPFNLTVTNITQYSVSLAWTPNFQGGQPRGYTLRYRPAGTLQYQFVEVSGGHTAGTTLGGLRPAGEYFFSIMARNDQGNSDYLSPPLLVTLLGVSGSNSSSSRWRVPRLILLIMTLTGAALLVLNIAIIACFVRRRSIARRSSGGMSRKAGASDTLCSTVGSATPGLHHDILFSLATANTANSSTLSNTLTTYKQEAQTLVDECERRGSGVSSTDRGRPSLALLQNGALVRKNSPSPQNGGGTVKTATSNVQPSGGSGCGRQNGGVPTQQTRISAPSPATTPLNGHLHPPTNPEVCSLTSSTYDTHSPTLPQQQLQRRDSGSQPADDQVSLASYHSTHSRTFSQGYVRPLPPPGCPYHPPSRPQPLCQGSSYYQSQQQSEKQQQSRPTYSSLSPSSLYTLSTEYYDAHCTQSSSSGAPMGYATLGPRSRRTSPSQFATLQRSRPSRTPVLNTLQSSGHQCASLSRCQGNDCCHQHTTDDDDDRHIVSACPTHHITDHPRRSSFHGPLWRDTQRYDNVGPVSFSRLHHQQQQQQHHHHHHQRQDSAPSGYNMMQQHSTDSLAYGLPQRHNSVSGDYSMTQHTDCDSSAYNTAQDSVAQHQETKTSEYSSAQRHDPKPSKVLQTHSFSHASCVTHGSSCTSHSNLANATTTPESPHDLTTTSSPSRRRDVNLRGSSSFRSSTSSKDSAGTLPTTTTAGRPKVTTTTSSRPGVPTATTASRLGTPTAMSRHRVLTTTAGRLAVSTADRPGVPTTNDGRPGVLAVNGGRSGVPTTNEGRSGVPATNGGRSGVPTTNGGRPGVSATNGGRLGAPTSNEDRPGIPTTNGGRSGVTATNGGRPEVPATNGDRPGVPAQNVSRPKVTNEGHPAVSTTNENRSEVPAASEGRPGVPTTNGSRPRFPHDYVRQGSAKGRPSATTITSPRATKEGTNLTNNTDKNNKVASSSSSPPS